MKKNLLLLLSSAALLASCATPASSSTPAPSSEPTPSSEPAPSSSSSEAAPSSSSSEAPKNVIVVKVNDAAVEVENAEPEWSDLLVFDYAFEADDELAITLDGEALHFYDWPDNVKTDLGTLFAISAAGQWRFGINASHEIWFVAPASPIEANITCTVDGEDREITDVTPEGWDCIAYYEVGLRADQVVTFSEDGEALHFWAWDEQGTGTDLGTSYTAAYGGYWHFGVNNEHQVWIDKPVEGVLPPEGVQDALYGAASEAMGRTNYMANGFFGLNAAVHAVIDEYGAYKYEEPTTYDNDLNVSGQVDLLYDPVTDEQTGAVEHQIQSDVWAAVDAHVAVPVLIETTSEEGGETTTEEAGETNAVVQDIRESLDRSSANADIYAKGGNLYVSLGSTAKSLFDDVLGILAKYLPIDVQSIEAMFPPEKFYTALPDEVGQYLPSAPRFLGMATYALGALVGAEDPLTGLSELPETVYESLSFLKGSDAGSWTLSLNMDSKKIGKLLEEAVPEDSEAYDYAAMAMLALELVDVSLLARLEKSGERLECHAELGVDVPDTNKATVTALVNALSANFGGPHFTEIDLDLDIALTLDVSEGMTIEYPADLDEYVPLGGENPVEAQ